MGYQLINTHSTWLKRLQRHLLLFFFHLSGKFYNLRNYHMNSRTSILLPKARYIFEQRTLTLMYNHLSLLRPQAIIISDGYLGNILTRGKAPRENQQ